MQPLWRNPSLAYFRLTPNPQVRARYSIKSLRDIMLTYTQLCRVFFRYIQLHHAARAQFPSRPLLQLDSVEMVLSQEGLRKLLSALYGTLLRTDSLKIEKLWSLWKEDVPSLDREDWEDSLERSPKLVISSRDNLIQTKLLHRVYYRPVRLHKMYLDRDSFCSRCRTQLGTLMHML